jgi:mannose-6-phosphate isomerase-like protein (cupin superfamily)
MTQIDQTAPPGKYLVDTYEDWAKGEGIPIVTGAAIDLLAVEPEPWARFGVDGAFCHLDGRCDFLTVFLIELPPGSASAPQKHLYEEVCYGLAGSGTTEIEFAGGETRTIEWGPRGVFAVPMNARYRHRNSSSAPARFAAVSDLRYMLNLYRNENFIFATPNSFPERDGEILLPDAAALALQATTAGGGMTSLSPTLANGSIGTDLVELAPGTYGKASRQMQGSHLFGVSGEGFTLAWEEGADDFARTDWRHGVVYAPPGLAFHQHFNAGAAPARYLDLQLGSHRYPMFRSRRAAYGDKKVYASGSAEIAYADQDPRIHKMWLEAIAGKGVIARMP